MPGKLVCLDPGHGGTDSGAVGQAGTRESDVNLAIVREAAKKLRAAGHRVVMTRDRDTKVTLAQRVAIANNAHVDLFVSVHCNANGPTARGFEVWYWRSSAQGKLLAQTLQSRVVAEFPNLRDRGLKPSAPGHSPLYVLHHTDMPSVLFECAFISNSAEEALLAGPAAQARFAQAIARAVLVLPCL